MSKVIGNGPLAAVGSQVTSRSIMERKLSGWLCQRPMLNKTERELLTVAATQRYTLNGWYSGSGYGVLERAAC